MSKFKIGDEVRVFKVVVESEQYDIIGKSGVIVRHLTNREHFDWDVDFGDGGVLSVSEEEIEFMRYKYTRLAEKMFPKGHREGDWWVLE